MHSLFTLMLIHVFIVLLFFKLINKFVHPQTFIYLLRLELKLILKIIHTLVFIIIRSSDFTVQLILVLIHTNTHTPDKSIHITQTHTLSFNFFFILSRRLTHLPVDKIVLLQEINIDLM